MERRQSNFELLRIICMFLIVGFHIIGQTGMSDYGIKDGIAYYYCIFIGSAGRLVCNTFVMIGAWFLVDSKFKAERVVNLWIEIFLYSVVITIICIGIGCENANIITLVQSFLCFIFSYLVLCSMRLIADFMDFEPLRYLYTYYRGHYEALLGFACSFFLFLAFRNWKFRNNRIVNLISRSTFAVYIIHQTPAFYRYMWNGIFQVDVVVEVGNIISYSLFIIAVIFAVSVCLDNIRIFVMNKLICKGKAYQIVCKRLERFYQ